jgi:SAM-dependent methyltransferase
MDASWVIDELAYAGPEHLDPAYVAGYDRKAGHDRGVPDVEEDLAVLTARGLDRTATVVDLGAGTGAFAFPAASRFRRVVAVDVSPAMEAFLRERAASTGAAGTGVEFVRAGFLSYEHEGAPADAVVSRNALHQLPDLWKAMALERIGRMLRPGGVLRLRDLVFDCRPDEVPEVVRRWLDGAATDPAYGYTSEDFAEHLRTEHSTFRWLLEPMLAATGFTIVDAAFRASIYAAYTCVRR